MNNQIIEKIKDKLDAFDLYYVITYLDSYHVNEEDKKSINSEVQKWAYKNNIWTSNNDVIKSQAREIISKLTSKNSYNSNNNLPFYEEKKIEKNNQMVSLENIEFQKIETKEKQNKIEYPLKKDNKKLYHIALVSMLLLHLILRNIDIIYVVLLFFVLAILSSYF